MNFIALATLNLEPSLGDGTKHLTVIQSTIIPYRMAYAAGAITSHPEGGRERERERERDREREG